MCIRDSHWAERKCCARSACSSKMEFRQRMKELQPLLDVPLDYREVDRLFDSLDTDGSKYLEQSEIRQAMKQWHAASVEATELLQQQTEKVSQWVGALQEMSAAAMKAIQAAEQVDALQGELAEKSQPHTIEEQMARLVEEKSLDFAKFSRWSKRIAADDGNVSEAEFAMGLR
eukprot:4310419-Prymnesium_polylepis.1